MSACVALERRHIPAMTPGRSCSPLLFYVASLVLALGRAYRIYGYARTPRR